MEQSVWKLEGSVKEFKQQLKIHLLPTCYVLILLRTAVLLC